MSERDFSMSSELASNTSTYLGGGAIGSNDILLTLSILFKLPNLFTNLN